MTKPLSNKSASSRRIKARMLTASYRKQVRRERRVELVVDSVKYWLDVYGEKEFIGSKILQKGDLGPYEFGLITGAYAGNASRSSVDIHITQNGKVLLKAARNARVWDIMTLTGRDWEDHLHEVAAKILH